MGTRNSSTIRWYHAAVTGLWRGGHLWLLGMLAILSACLVANPASGEPAKKRRAWNPTPVVGAHGTL